MPAVKIYSSCSRGENRWLEENHSLLFQILLNDFCYRWFPIFYQFLLYSKETWLYILTYIHTYIYTYIYIYSLFLILSSITFRLKWSSDWLEIPELHGRTALLIHSKCNSLHLLTPNCPSLPLPPPSPLATTGLFSMSMSLLLFCRWVHLHHIPFCRSFSRSLVSPSSAQVLLSFLPHLVSLLLPALDEKGGDIRGNARDSQKVEGGSLWVDTGWASTQRKARLPWPLQRLFHIVFNHQRSLCKSRCWGSWVGSVLIFMNFPNPAPYFFLWSLGSTVRMLLCGWPSYGCPRKIFLFLTFSFKQWGCQCWKHKFRSIALGVCLLVSRFVYQKSSWKIMELNAFLGGGSSMWVFLFTLPPVSAWVVLLSVSSSSLAHS